MTKEEVFNLIRQRLSFGDELQQQLRHVDKDKFMKEHRRFEMSGFETQTGWCTVFNNDILNKFADLGIYNYTSYLFLDFYMGVPTVYLKYFSEDENLSEIESSDIHQRLHLQKGKYILLSAHREENIDTEKNFLSLFSAVNAMAEKYDMPILYSCHPRSRKRLESSGFALDSRVIQHEPLGFHDYNCLQMNAYAVVSDSGTLPEESSFFTSVGHPFPAVCIRTSTERPEALDKGIFVLAGIDGTSLLQAVDTAVEMNRNGDDGLPVPNYTDENVSAKVVKIIQSYTGVVNKMVWRKF